MKILSIMLLAAALFTACGTGQPKVTKPEAAKKDTVKTVPPADENMWKIASYAGQVGDSKNSSYVTNTYAIWGTYRRSSVDNTELKVKFLIDKVSFCIKLYEYGQKIVTKGDENVYRVSVKSGEGEPLQFMAKNVSDRIFINEADAKSIMDLFAKGEKVTFSMTTDSKSDPASYAFSLDHPGGLAETLAKVSR